MEILDFIIVAICGFGIGTLSGMFGIGGGGMIVPLLHMAFGIPMVSAAATSLLTIAPTGLSGSIKHIRQKTISLKTGLFIGGFGAIASVASSFLAGSLQEWLIVVITVTVILFSVGMMVRTIIIQKRAEDEAQNTDNSRGRPLRVYDELTRTVPVSYPASSNAAINAAADVIAGAATTKAQEQESKKVGAKAIALPVVIGLIAGGIAGIVGVGGGFIIIPFCVTYLGFTLKKAAGTSLLSIAIIAIPGIIAHAYLGHIEWFYGIAIIVGSIPGAQLGAWLIARLPERPMRIAFACLLASTGLLLLAQEFLF